MNNAAHFLHKETEAAKTLLAQMADILGDDDDAKRDLIEGETNIYDAIASTVQRIGEDEAFIQGLSEYVERLQSRSERIKQRIANARTALAVAMDHAGKKKMETPFGTVSLRPTPRNAVVIEESEIPSEYWKAQAPKLDKSALAKALRAGTEIPGAQLSNGGETISISR